MGKLETNSGNDDVAGAPGVRGLWVGREVTPAGGMLHVATGAAEAPTISQFNALRTDAKDVNVTLLAFWNSLSAVCPVWTARLATAAAAAGLTQTEWRQAARDACAA